MDLRWGMPSRQGPQSIASVQFITYTTCLRLIKEVLQIIGGVLITVYTLRKQILQKSMRITRGIIICRASRARFTFLSGLRID